MSKKFKGTKMSLSELGAVVPDALPKAPVERDGNEEAYDRRGFRIRDEGSRYGGGRSDRYGGGDREGPGGEDVSNWRDREGPSGGGDREGPRRGFGGFDRDREGPGADDSGDWRSGDRPSYGSRDRDRGGFGGGFRDRDRDDRGFGGDRDRDRGSFGDRDRDRGGDRYGGDRGGDRYGGGGRFDAGGDRGKSWGTVRGDREESRDSPRDRDSGPSGADRPRLKLAPRTAPLPERSSPQAKANVPSPPPAASAAEPKCADAPKPKANPFGAAKPREEVLKEKGVPVPAEEPPRRAASPPRRRDSPPRRRDSPPRRRESPPRREPSSADKWERVGPLSEGRGRAQDREPPKDKRSPSPLPASVQSNIAEKLKKEVDMIVGEYLLNAGSPGAVDEAVRSMEELWTGAGDGEGEGDTEAEIAPIVIKRTITIALEKKKGKELGEIARLVGALRKRSAVSRQSLERGLERVLDSVMDLKLDLPDAPKLAGEFLGLAVAGDFLNILDVVDLFPETLVRSGEAGYMVVDALHKMADELGDKTMKELYLSSKARRPPAPPRRPRPETEQVNFEPLFGGKSARDYLATKGLKFLFQ